MRDKHYKNRSIRVSDEIWEKLKERQKSSQKSWNLFVLELLSNKKNDKNS